MAQDKKATEEKLTALWQDQSTLTLTTRGLKYVIISDTHMGDGGEADDFRENEKALTRALAYYKDNGYHLILLGDVEEFWQFDLERIAKKYGNSVYAALKAFDGDRVFRVYGNHDSEWGCPPDPARKNSNGRKGSPEAIKLRDVNSQASILLVHGHQGSKDADKYSWFSRFVVRGLFKPIEGAAKWLGLYGHPAATKSQVTKDYEKIFYDWAKANKVIVICGHSHRAIFASRSYVDRLQQQLEDAQASILSNRGNEATMRVKLREVEKLRQQLADEKDKGRDITPMEPNGKTLPCYFNSGCALYTDGLTAIEITGDVIRLVKWSRNAVQDAPEEFDRGSLNEFIQKVRDDGR